MMARSAAHALDAEHPYGSGARMVRHQALSVAVFVDQKNECHMGVGDA
jgi:hypothetical protein